MKTKRIILFIAALAVVGGFAAAQNMPWLYWTFLPKGQMDLIVGESSGQAAMRTIIDINGYNRDRSAEEYAGPFWETQVILKYLKQFGFSNAKLVSSPATGVTYDVIKGDLWEVKPRLQKLASATDLFAMVASGSANTDVTAELAWVGRGHARRGRRGQGRGKGRRHRGLARPGL